MAIARYLTHPQVTIDPAVPVPNWRLSERGAIRAALLTEASWVSGLERIVSSDETKAIETAAIIATATGLQIEVRANLGENDRSATGFLPPAEFEAVADQFFADPDASARGWATARAEQVRVVEAIGAALRDHGDAGDVLFVGHGGVGTLNLCHLLGVPISRALDQTGGGGGNVYAWDVVTGRILHRWRTIEDEVALAKGTTEA
jgi:broad specificity phosphatase PhoE